MEILKRLDNKRALEAVLMSTGRVYSPAIGHAMQIIVVSNFLTKFI